jgi:hypothetical protein
MFEEAEATGQGQGGTAREARWDGQRAPEDPQVLREAAQIR